LGLLEQKSQQNAAGEPPIKRGPVKLLGTTAVGCLVYVSVLSKTTTWWFRLLGYHG
jgi:hypothetical protein